MDVFTYGDHRAFVTVEGWEKAGELGGHVNYLLRVNPPSAVLRTGISHGADSKEYFSPGIRSTIVHQQLQVTQAEFWACVNEGKRPEGAPQRWVQRRLARSGRRASAAAESGAPAGAGARVRGIPAEVASMSDTELRAYLTVLWHRRAHDTAGGGEG